MSHPIFQTHLRQSGQVHQGQVEYVRAVYAQRDRKLRNTLVLACDTERLLLNLPSNVLEVRELLVDVQELAPLACDGRALGGVNELQDERPPGNDALPAGEEVSADDAAWWNELRMELAQSKEKQTSPGH
jgi:hypothetical protein